MPLSSEDRALAELLASRGVVAPPVLAECVREGDALEAAGQPRLPLGVHLVQRGVLSPDLFARARAALASSGSARLPTATVATPPPQPVPNEHLETSLRTRAARAEPIVEGTTLGPYRLESELGRGAMGTVWRGRHANSGAVAAIKLLPAAGPKSALDRFEREVQAIAKLQHPNVVGIHEAGETAQWRWFAMDLVEGAPLDRLLRERAVTVGQFVDLAIQIAHGMEHAHARGIVHRDLKPSNVLVTRDGHARVTDFGVAKHLDRATLLTQAGALVGTPYYMAPEQVSGASASADHRTDTWALGVMLFEAATGRVPFSAETPIELARTICEEDPPRPSSLVPDLPRDLEAIILRALEKDPARRYPTMAALARDLESFLRGERVSASRHSLVSDFVRRASRRKGLWATVALGSLALVGVGVAGATFLVRARRASSIEEQRRAVRDRVAEAELELGRALERARKALVRSSGEARFVSREALLRLEERRAHLEDAIVAAEPRKEASAQRERLGALPARGSLVLALARAHLLEGETRAARALLEKEHGPAPRDVDAALVLADACLVLGDARAACEALSEKGVAATSDRWETLLRRVVARARAGRADDASAADLARARSLGAPPAALEEAKAEDLVARGRTADALALLGKAITVHLEAPGLRVARARLHVAAGDVAAAVADLRAAGDRDPQAAREEARLHLEASARADAARALERVLRNAPDDVASALLLGELRAALGRLDEAARGLRDLAARLAAHGEAATPDLVTVLETLVPIEQALGAPPPGARERLAALGAARSASEPERRARAFRFARAEGRSDALVILDGGASCAIRRREEERRKISPLEGAPFAPPDPALVARARRSLDYARALDPGSSEIASLEARLVERAGDPALARTLADAALARDPLDASAACVRIRIARREEAGALLGSTRAAADAGGPGSVELRILRVGLLRMTDAKKEAAALALALVEERPRDRELRLLAAEALEDAGDPRAGSERATLARLDADVDRARVLASKGENLGASDTERAAALLLEAYELAPDDAETLGTVAAGARRLTRVVGATTGAMVVLRDGTDSVTAIARHARHDGRYTVDYLKHVHGERNFLLHEQVYRWRAAMVVATPDERRTLALAIALVDGSNALYGELKEDRYVSVRQGKASDGALERVERLVEEEGHLPVLYATRAAILARAGHPASMERDLERCLGRRPFTFMDGWLAAALRLAGNDLEGAEREALRAVEFPWRREVPRIDLVDDQPFRDIADSKAWARVVAAVKGR